MRHGDIPRAGRPSCRDARASSPAGQPKRRHDWTSTLVSAARSAPAASPPDVPGRTSWCLMSSVLIQRCWPNVKAMKNPSSTSSWTEKLARSRSQSPSSAIEESHMIALVQVSAAFSRSVKRSDCWKFSSSSYLASSSLPAARAERWTPQYSQSIDLET